MAAEAEVPAEPIHVNGRAICPRPFPARIDNHVFADAYNTGAGAVVSVEGQEAAASSNVLALRQMAPPGMSADSDNLVERARREIEFMTASLFPPLVRDDSSTLRELWAFWTSSWPRAPSRGRTPENITKW